MGDGEFDRVGRCVRVSWWILVSVCLYGLMVVLGGMVFGVVAILAVCCLDVLGDLVEWSGSLGGI
jgi:hypothetical protein